MKKISFQAPLVIQNIGFSTITNLFDRLGTALVLFLVSKELGKVATGSYELGTTYFSLGIIFAAWGLGNLLVREVASRKQEFPRYFSNYLITRLMMGAATCLLIVLLGWSLPNYEVTTRLVIMTLAFCIPITAMSSLFQSAFIAFEKLKIPSMISVSTTLLKVAGTYLLIYFTPDPLLKVVWFQVAVHALVLAIYLAAAHFLLPVWTSTVDWKFIRKQLIFAAPFFLYAAIMTLDNRIDVILISLFMKEDSVGTYGIMTMLLGIVYLPPDGIRNAILPALVRYQSRGLELLQEKFRLMIKYGLLITVPIASAGFFLSRHVVHFLYQHQYEPVICLLQISIWSVISYTLIILFSQLLIIQKMEKKVVRFALISAVVTVLLNLLTISFYGLEGVAFVKLITSGLLLVLLMVATWRAGFRFSVGKDVACILFAGVAMTIAISFSNELWIGIRIGIGFIIYFIVLNITKTFSIREALETVGLKV